MVDWTDVFEAEYNATWERYNKQQARLEKQEGFGSTDAGMGIVRANLDHLVTTYEHHIGLASSANGTVAGLVPLLRNLDKHLMALCALQTLLHTIGTGVVFGQQVTELGLALEAECFREGLTKADRKVASAVAAKVRSARGNTAAKRGKARVLAAKAGFRVPEWAPDCLVAAGGWMLDWAVSTLPGVFVISGRDSQKAVRLTDEALDLARKAIGYAADRRPVFLPRPEKPAPWTRIQAQHDVGPLIQHRALLLRTTHQDRLAAARGAIKDGSMQDAMDGLNALQGVPWRINRQVLLVQMACVYAGIQVEGLPGKRLDLKAEVARAGLDPKKPWADMAQEERSLWITKSRAVRNHNDALVGEQLSLAEDWAAAKMYRDQPFWTGMNMDWRGRVYGRCGFNFQREDRVRSLFLFSQGEPLGEYGLKALYIHAANCWAGPLGEHDKRKTDKVPMGERIEWATKNLDKIIACARSPLTERWWMTGDAPWLFLAVALEICSALSSRDMARYVCRLPVSFDGSCSGVQHLCLLTRAPEGRLVNLLPSAEPADVYATVATAACAQIETDAARGDWPDGEEWRGEVARLALAYGVDRKMAKRNTMTWAYSSKKYGMGGQQQEDLMDTLAHDILTGKREGEHPFAPYHRGSVDRPGKAARYLGSIFYDAIQEVMCLPGEAMLFLQGCAKALAHEGKYVEWVASSGLPCINHYNPITTEKICLYTHIKGVKVRHETRKAAGEEAEVDKDRAANGIAPNFVHSHDAAHVHLVARACAAVGIDLATVHDSFGCLPSRATQMNRILREQLVLMYEGRDLLQEVYDRAHSALTATGRQRLPKPPKQGNLNIREVLDAEYAFA